MRDAAGKIIGLIGISRDVRAPIGTREIPVEFAAALEHFETNLAEPITPSALARRAQLAPPRYARPKHSDWTRLKYRKSEKAGRRKAGREATGAAGVAPAPAPFAATGWKTIWLAKALDQPPTGLGQARSTGGTTHLIGHHPQGFTSSSLEAMQTQHGEQKILAPRAIHPARPQHGPPPQGQGPQHRPFTRGLGGAVHP
jgi:hypothetical protein